MDDATLDAFRQVHRDMLAARGESEETNNWQWIGRWDSQRMFGISEQRAKEYADRYGGVASKMSPTSTFTDDNERSNGRWQAQFNR